MRSTVKLMRPKTSYGCMLEIANLPAVSNIVTVIVPIVCVNDIIDVHMSNKTRRRDSVC